MKIKGFLNYIFFISFLNFPIYGAEVPLCPISTILNNASVDTDLIPMLVGSFSHPSNTRLSGITNVEEVTNDALHVLNRTTPGLRPKEVESLKHQDDLVAALNPQVKKKLEDSGFDSSAYYRGVADSDMGKTDEYMKLLFEPSAKSDLLLNFLTGRNPPRKSQDVLRKLLDEMNFKGKWPLNPEFDNDTLRGAFSRNRVLLGFLHEFPGMADAVILFEKGALTEEQFKKQLMANLFHNGPAEGFWKLISDVFVPGALKNDKNPPKDKEFFKGTIFDQSDKVAPVNGLYIPSYPSPKSYEGLVHSFFDRMSQATRGGVIKIFEEIRGFSPNPLNAMEDLLFNNPKNTLKQIQELEKITTSSTSLGDKQKNVLLKLISNGTERLKVYNDDVLKGINVERVETTQGKYDVKSIVIKHSDGSFVVFKNNDNGTSEMTRTTPGKSAETTYFEKEKSGGSGPFADSLKNEIEKSLLENEKLHQNPVRDLKIE